MSYFPNHHLFILLMLASISLKAFGREDWQQETRDLVDSINSLNQQSSLPPCPTSIVDAAPTELEKWSLAGFENPTIDLIEPKLTAAYTKKKFTHEVKLTMVLLRNSGWSQKNMQQRLTRVAEVYSQCGIRIARSKLVTVDAPNGWVDIDYKNEQRDLKIASMIPATEKPIIYYVRSNIEGSNAYAWNQSSNRPAPLTNTAWITSIVNKPAYTETRDHSYSPDAHELGHILGNCGHNDLSSNFLASEVILLNDKILPDQCESLKKNNLVKAL